MRAGEPARRRRRIPTIGAALALTLAVSGCETINPITLGIGVASYVVTGKGLADHALGIVADKDCNLIEGLLSAERGICEPKGSYPTRGGFGGLLSYRDAGAADRSVIEPRLRLSESRYDPRQSTPRETTLTADALALRLSESIAPATRAPDGNAAYAPHEPPRRLASL
jgi:hypothetical protein